MLLDKFLFKIFKTNRGKQVSFSEPLVFCVCIASYCDGRTVRRYGAQISRKIYTPPQNIRIGVMEYIETAEDTQRCRSSGSWAFRSQVECLLVAHEPYYTGYTDLVSRHAVYTQIYTCAFLTAMFLGNPKWPSWCGERCAGALIACHGYSARRTRRAWSRSARCSLVIPSLYRAGCRSSGSMYGTSERRITASTTPRRRAAPFSLRHGPFEGGSGAASARCAGGECTDGKRTGQSTGVGTNIFCFRWARGNLM